MITGFNYSLHFTVSKPRMHPLHCTEATLTRILMIYVQRIIRPVNGHSPTALDQSFLKDFACSFY
jgi:hypothetical protein